MKMPEKFTEQSLVEYVVPLLHKQGIRSTDNGEDSPLDDCKYNGFNGRHCAIGFIIPVELYDPKWDREAMTVSEIMQKIPSISELPPNFLTEVQNLHDLSFGGGPSEEGFKALAFKIKVRAFCRVWNLSFAFLNKLEFKE